MSTILVVDDKEMMRDSVASTLSQKGHTVVTAVNGVTALQRVSQRTFDAIVTDLQMPEMDGLGLLDAIGPIDDQVPVVVMTAYGSIETAVEAMKRGAYDYLTKPFSGDILLQTVERAIEHSRLVKENQILRASMSQTSDASLMPAHALVGGGMTMQSIKQEIAKIACSHATVLLCGESGSGKEVAARSIHEQSQRSKGPFLALNCAALSSTLLESELFGHERGAFTGADKLRKGRFELADGGTLLLDEISEIAPELQAKLLRVLQEQAFERVGSSTSRSVDVRVIATSNRDLQAEVRDGKFREDLFYRLNVLPMRMPPLREHTDDIPLLTAHFLQQVAQREGRHVKQFEPQAMQRLMQYAWPGNVRELQNVCERAAVLSSNDMIQESLVGPWLGSTAKDRFSVAIETKPVNTRVHNIPVIDGSYWTVNEHLVCAGDITLEQIERDAIVATLRKHDGHRQRSASALGIGVRTLGLKLKKWKEMQVVEQSL
ncbi:MAG: sigma-54 dependent transcriptional regulator [Phycisphaerales bacterium]|nr:sigma-54 dependent transcriptional regulator [Phycisphaerales bacterium]